MPFTTKTIVRVAILAAGAAALMGCSAIRNATGLGKEPPDEFAVVTKAPLIMPPDYNLRPPRDGAPPLNQVAPTDAAQSALLDTGNGSASASGDLSESEKQLLASANATNPDPSIRQLVAADGRAMEAANDSFTQKVLFWQGDKDEGHGVDADAEAKRLEEQKNAGQQAVTPAKKPKDSATIDKKEDKGGWFDWF
ncbi:MAG TPA: DUF3035 domain-containing protein [Rhizomicrobium sp.]|nr:DUF3035 domain-containing protein [Rhizomicrobium sp.]